MKSTKNPLIILLTLVLLTASLMANVGSVKADGVVAYFYEEPDSEPVAIADLSTPVESYQGMQALCDKNILKLNQDVEYIGSIDSIGMTDETAIDLNGYTLTISFSESFESLSAIYYACQENDKVAAIKNGTIDINLNGISNSTVVLFAIAGGQFLMEDVNITCSNYGSSNTILPFFLSQQVSASDGMDGYVLTLRDCSLDVETEDGLVVSMENYNGSNNTDVSIESGCYEGLDVNSFSSDKGSITGTKLSNLPETVDSSKYVYASENTVAMRIANGNVYTYDNLQDAIDDVEDGGVVYLLKDSSDTVSANKEFTLNSNFYSVDVKPQVTPGEGLESTIDENGNIVIGPSTSSGNISIDRNSLSLHPNSSTKLTLSNAEGKTVTWTSSDDKVATVGEDGTVNALTVGKAIIKASVGKETFECLVTVEHSYVWVIDRTATENRTGLKHRECTFCGHSLGSVTIPKLDKEESTVVIVDTSTK